MMDNNRRRLSMMNGSSTASQSSSSTPTPTSSSRRSRVQAGRSSSMNHNTSSQSRQMLLQPHQLSPHQQNYHHSPAVKMMTTPQQQQQHQSRPSSSSSSSSSQQQRSSSNRRSGSVPPSEQQRTSSSSRSRSATRNKSKNNTSSSNNYPPPLQHMGQFHTTHSTHNKTYQHQQQQLQQQQQKEMQMRQQQYHQQQQQLRDSFSALPHNHSNNRSIHSHHSRSSSGGTTTTANNQNRANGSDNGSVHSGPTVNTAAYSNGSHTSGGGGGGGHDNNSQRSQRSTASDPHAHGGRGRGRSTSRQQHQPPRSASARSSGGSRRSTTPNGGNGGNGTFDLIHEEHRDPFAETTSTRSRSSHQHQQQQNQNHNTNGSRNDLMIHPTPFKQQSQHQHQQRYSSNTIASTPTSNSSNRKNIPAVVSTNKHFIKSTKKVIEELKKSADGSYPGNKRVIALTNACAEFDHLDDSRHNLELQQGAATSLCRVLAVVLNIADDQECIDDADDELENSHNDINDCQNTHVSALTNEDVNHTDDALRMIATALEMVFRGQGTYVHTAYDKCGGTTKYESSNIGGRPSGLLPCLLRLLDRAEGVHYGTHCMKRHNSDVSLLNTTKVLLYLSRVPELRQHLARQPSLLDALCRVGNNLNKSNSNNNVSTITLNGEEARVTRVRIIANLVNEEENKPLLLVHVDGKGAGGDNGLLHALLRIAHIDPNERSREYASVALMDLASSPQNQIIMTKNERLLATLVMMVLVERGGGPKSTTTNSTTTSSSSTAVNGVVGTPIRESAITALQNLAFTKENRIRLVLFKNGIVLEALLKVLNRSGSSSSTNNDSVVVGSNDNKSRRRAAGALTNLACDETAEIMGRHSKLLQTLAIVSTKDPSPEVQIRSAMALTKLAASLTIRMDYTDNDSDVQQQQDNNQDTTTAVPNHHHRDGSSSTYSSSSSQQQQQQQQQGGNDNTTANGGTTGCTNSLYSTLLDALVVASLSPVSNSVSAVLRVKARDPENRFIMAHHPGILDTLADMCMNLNNTNSNLTNKVYNNNGNGNNNNNDTVTDVIKDRDNATRALMHLTNESKNRSTMCTATVLDALVKGASITDDEIDMNTSPPPPSAITNSNNENSATRQALEEVRDSAVRALERLATEFPNRSKMAHHNGLLVAIAQATERESKLEQAQQDCQNSIAGTCSASISNASVRSGTSGSSSVRSNSNINHCVATPPTTPSSTNHQQQQQQQHHAYLAKPLLMSLLVAM